MQTKIDDGMISHRSSKKKSAAMTPVPAVREKNTKSAAWFKLG